MEEEVFDRKNADELTLRIAERLGERQQKLDRMAEWEHGARKVAWRPMVLSAIAIAACLVVAFVVIAPWRTTEVSPLDELGIAAPTFEDYRSALPESSEISRLIADEKYAEALPKVEAALKNSDRELSYLEMALIENNDEVLLYSEEAEQVQNGELRWAYIYLLVRLDRKEDALAELKRYLRQPSRFISHKEEAKALRKKLKN